MATAAEPPATALVAEAAGSASATFTELGAFEHSSQLGEVFNRIASAGDTVLITAPSAPAGATRLELTWRLVGS